MNANPVTPEEVPKQTTSRRPTMRAIVRWTNGNLITARGSYNWLCRFFGEQNIVFVFVK